MDQVAGLRRGVPGIRAVGARLVGPLLLLGVATLVTAGGTAHAQQAPLVPAAPAVVAQILGSVSGSVTDTDGALVPEARITLSAGDPATERQALADGEGQFHFDGVAAGAYRLSVSAHGLATMKSSGVLRAGEDAELAPITLRVSVETDVEVTKTSEELAELEIHTEEQQRLLGFAPNFFVSYNWDAQRLTVRQKFQLARKSVLDPVTFVIVGGIAGVDQAQNAFPGFGQGAAGYGKRYGAGFADVAIGTTLGGAVFPSLFHQDPRYFYKGRGSKASRALYALSTAVRQRGDNGKWQVGYSSILGDLTTGAISNLYYPASDRHGASLTLENGFLAVAFDGIGNLVQEFLFKKLSTGVKKSAAP